MGREFELKFAATPQNHADLQGRYGTFAPIAMETVYYDTPERALSARHITLRRRLENEIPVCTLKTPAANGGRGEWELECDDILAAIPELCKLSGMAELADLTQSGIQEVCGARFTRLAKTLVLTDCTLELALDSGILLGGGKEMPLCEIEVEAKSGSEEAVAAFAQSLAEEFRLKPQPKSKFRRAMELAEGENHV